MDFECPESHGRTKAFKEEQLLLVLHRDISCRCTNQQRSEEIIVKALFVINDYECYAHAISLKCNIQNIASTY